jgi:hypothetical protein
MLIDITHQVNADLKLIIGRSRHLHSQQPDMVKFIEKSLLDWEINTQG